MLVRPWIQDTIAYGTDNADLYTILNFVFDRTNPTISVTSSPAANENGWNNGDVDVTIRTADGDAGLHDVSYVITRNGTQIVSGTQTTDDDEQSLFGDITHTLSDGGIYVITVTAHDNAGNETVASHTVRIDKVTPTVSDVTTVPQNWTNDFVEISFHVVQNNETDNRSAFTVKVNGTTITLGAEGMDDPCKMTLLIKEAVISGGSVTYYLPTGNYKILGRLTVNKVAVAEDYFVFNVNRTGITDRINIGEVLQGE